jgi:hypothetical protein
MRVLPDRRLVCEQGAKRFAIGRRGVFPIGANWIPAVAQSLFVGIAVLRNDRGDPLGLNQLLERDERYGEIVADVTGGVSTFEFRANRRWKSAESLLMPIAEAMARLVCDEDFTHVKACEGPRCTLVFADHTRGHARRWCSMAICGNRAKVAAHRARLKEQESS